MPLQPLPNAASVKAVLLVARKGDEHFSAIEIAQAYRAIVIVDLTRVTENKGRQYFQVKSGQSALAGFTEHGRVVA